jgi:hypothetical protein
MQYPLRSPGQAVLYLRRTKTGKAMRTLCYTRSIIYKAELVVDDLLCQVYGFGSA